MASNDSIFSHEFKEMMNQRKAVNGGFSITQIPIPKMNLINKDFYVAGGKLALVKGIREPYFEDLNGETVEIVKGRSFDKRTVLTESDGTVNFRKDKNGSFITTEIDLESNFVAVYSSKNIHLPNKVEVNGVKKEHKVTTGYNFIDYIDTKNGRKFLYTVPMEAVFPLELCALVIALNKHRAYYKGCKVALTNGHYVYIYSIPYKYRENTGYVLLGAKANPNFDKEMSMLLDYWMQNGILFDLNTTALEEQIGGKNNLGIEDLPGTTNYEDYKKIGNALKGLEELEELNEFSESLCHI